jgi:hypothetical protein
MASTSKFLEVPVERLKEVFYYDSESGELRWKKKPSKYGCVKPGDIAGCHQKGPGSHRVVRIDGILLLVHRVAWAMHYGVWPKHDVDHRNRIPDANAIANLRECANGIVNEQNTFEKRRHNTSGFVGVIKQKQCVSDRWCARITVRGKVVHLGSFGSPAEAHAAYLEAKRILHPASS